MLDNLAHVFGAQERVAEASAIACALDGIVASVRPLAIRRIGDPRVALDVGEHVLPPAEAEIGLAIGCVESLAH
jgi:hypothetical protein